MLIDAYDNLETPTSWAADKIFPRTLRFFAQQRIKEFPKSIHFQDNDKKPKGKDQYGCKSEEEDEDLFGKCLIEESNESLIEELNETG